MAENASSLVEKEQPTGDVQHTEHHKKRNGQQPQGFGQCPEHGYGQLMQGKRQHTGAHGGGEPVGGELANDFAGMLQMAQGPKALGLNSGL
ncbi:hypothetical protein D3C78_1597710 [compost metagenome]